MPTVFPASYPANARVMIFVDGENLSIRFKSLVETEKMGPLQDHIEYVEDVYVWSRFLNLRDQSQCAIIRVFDYTSLRGDDAKITETFDVIKGFGVTDPRVFKKKSNNRTKRVDITLATDMLNHAYSDNFDIAVLVAGDEDYVPLVQEVKHRGKQVSLWFLENGLSPDLKRECDSFYDLKAMFLRDRKTLSGYT